jgi:hypothetical protein
MVDRDKIKSRMDSDEGGSSEDDDEPSRLAKKRKKKKKKKEKSKSKDTSSSSSSSSGSSSPSGKVKRSDYSSILGALGNMLLYVEGKHRALKDPDGMKEKVKYRISGRIYDQYTDMVSEDNIQYICEKYNIDWEEDVLDSILEDQDYSKVVHGSKDAHTSVVSVGRGSKIEMKHFRQTLKSVANLYMFVNVLKKKHKNPSGTKEKIGKELIDDVSNENLDFLGGFRVDEIAEKYGINFEDDIIGGLG